MDEEQYVSFGEVARRQLGEQAQYARHYLKDAVLSAGVRWQGDVEEYHTLTIHRDDVDGFVARVQQHRRDRGEIR